MNAESAESALRFAEDIDPEPDSSAFALRPLRQDLLIFAWRFLPAEKSEHPVLVRRLGRDFLAHIPQFHDAVVLEPEEVNHGGSFLRLVVPDV